MHPKQHDPISSIPVMGGSALDVMCALFLPQWSELKAHEKPIQSLLPAGLRLVPTAWACRRSPSPRTRAVSLFQPLFQTLKEEHPAVEDKTAKSPWHLTASTRVLSSARRMGRDRVWRSTDGADGPKQKHDADPSDGLSAKASVVSRAIRPCLRQGCRRPCVAHAQQTAIWRPSGGRSLAGEGRRGGAARGLLGDPSNELCRGEVRWGESSSATPCAFPRLSHWEVFAVPLRVVYNSRSMVC